MANRYGATARLAAFALGFFIAASSGTAYAIPLSRGAWPIYTAVVEKTTAPSGWAEFCRNYKSECDVQQSLPRKIALTAEVWDKLSEVNHWANAHIKPTPDRKHWGRINKWYFAEDGRGDCKDYVLVKRRMLMQAGLPREALLITVVWTPQDNGHAVLIVRTDKGDYVLDNLSSKVVLWNQTPYDYVMRQTQSDPSTWVYIDGDPLKPRKLAEDLAENPLDEPTIMVSDLNTGAPKQEVIAAGGSDSGTRSHAFANRSMDDSAPSRRAVAASAADDGIPRLQMGIDRGSDSSTLVLSTLVSPTSMAAAPKQQNSALLGDASVSKQQVPTINTINPIDSVTVSQLLANGIDADALLQLALANKFKR
jgi:predicted transglutaminase-like cysteine proteinase